MNIADCLAKRVLVQVRGIHHIHVSVPICLSPSKQYVRFLPLVEDSDEDLGWQRVDEIEVLEVLGPADLAPSEMYRRFNGR